MDEAGVQKKGSGQRTLYANDGRFGNDPVGSRSLLTDFIEGSNNQVCVLPELLVAI